MSKTEKQTKISLPEALVQKIDDIAEKRKIPRNRICEIILMAGIQNIGEVERMDAEFEEEQRC